MARPVVEILSFEGCPNRQDAYDLVARVVSGTGVHAEVRLVDVHDPESAERMRFLGSPTVRVNGRDVEPGAADRTDFTFGCRIYATSDGYSGAPAEAWVVDALRSLTEGSAD